MKNRKITLVILIVLTLLNFGCGTNKSILEKDFDSENISLTGNIIEVTVNDKRTDVTDKKIELPFLSSPKSYDKVSPFITPKQEEKIKNEIKSYFNNNGQDLKVKINILQGYKEFSATFFHEREYAEFSIHLQIIDLNNHILEECKSSGFIETKTLDATYERMELVYNKALEMAIFKCLEEISK
ncbi:hypothetical protein [Christiangramia echinicola]|uniref:hypothetical protein n=1 Tax=Christiangramia echinicola TaxID=279359 RepID=UPI0003FD9207|nr:hypothetical protein [Christiangramia echinicola]